MRNYLKLNVAACTLFYNAGVNSTPFYAFYDNPEDLLQYIEFYKARFVLSWSGNDDIKTVEKYFKMDKSEVITALNAGYANSSPAAFAIWNQPSPDTESAAALRAIFVDKSPRKKGRHG